MKSILLVYLISFTVSNTNKTLVTSNVDKSRIQQICYEKDFEIGSKAIQKQIGDYIGKISDEELPIIVIQRKQDSLLTYISATMSTKFLVKKHPSYLAEINGRNVAVYNEEQVGIKPEECLSQMVELYRTKLRFDKINTKNGTNNAEASYGYDPIRIRLGIVADKIVSVDRQYPYFRPIPLIE